jgi:hypothetical protein
LWSRECGVEEAGDFGIKMNVEMPRDSVARRDKKCCFMEG